MKATCVVLSYGTLLLGLSYGWQPRPFQQLTSSFGQHHKHNEEGHKVRRLQRLLLHNNGHTMQFRNEGKLSKCNALAIYKLYLSTNNNLVEKSTVPNIQICTNATNLQQQLFSIFHSFLYLLLFTC